MRGSGTEILLSVFYPKWGEHGSLISGKKTLNKISVPEPSFYMCVGGNSKFNRFLVGSLFLAPFFLPAGFARLLLIYSREYKRE